MSKDLRFLDLEEDSEAPFSSFRRWKREEIHRLERFYEAGLTVREIARRLGRTKPAVASKAREMGLVSRNARRDWDATETERALTLAAKGHSAREIAALLGRSRIAVKEKLRHVGFGRAAAQPWTAVEIETLKTALAARMPVRRVAELVGRSASACRSKAKLLGIATDIEGARPWSKDEHSLLRALYARGVAPKKIASRLGRSLRSVYTEASKIGATGRLRRRWLPEDDRRLAELAGRVSFAEASRILGRSYGSVARRATKLGISFRRSGVFPDGSRRKPSPKLAREIRALLEAGTEIEETAARLGRKPVTVRRIARAHGLPLPPPKRSGRKFVLRDDEAATLREAQAAGMTLAAAAERAGMSVPRARRAAAALGLVFRSRRLWPVEGDAALMAAHQAGTDLRSAAARLGVSCDRARERARALGLDFSRCRRQREATTRERKTVARQRKASTPKLFVHPPPLRTRAMSAEEERRAQEEFLRAKREREGASLPTIEDVRRWLQSRDYEVVRRGAGWRVDRHLFPDDDALVEFANRCRARIGLPPFGAVASVCAAA